MAKSMSRKGGCAEGPAHERREGKAERAREYGKGGGNKGTMVQNIHMGPSALPRKKGR